LVRSSSSCKQRFPGSLSLPRKIAFPDGGDLLNVGIESSSLLCAATPAAWRYSPRSRGVVLNFRIEARIISRSIGECNGWLGIAALPCCQGGSAIGLSAAGALAEPLPVMDGNLHHPIPVPHNALESRLDLWRIQCDLHDTVLASHETILQSREFIAKADNTLARR
jgi:hypothetical protein